MCALFGFLQYSSDKKMPYRKLLKLVRELSIASECRGTDATGISYVRKSKIVTFKKPKPAHQIRLFFPRDTTALIGHTRMTTCGDEKFNYNNHPFEGSTSGHKFALAHNGVIYDAEYIKKNRNLPKTKIETDSYVAVQLLERFNKVNMESLKTMAEIVSGSFVFTVLRNDNMLFIVRGSNPVKLIHVPEYGIYIYASTQEILFTALKSIGFKKEYELIDIEKGNIVGISSGGKIIGDKFEFVPEESVYFPASLYSDYRNKYEEEHINDLYSVCGYFGVDSEDIDLLLDYGFNSDEIEEMMTDTQLIEDALLYIKNLSCVH